MQRVKRRIFSGAVCEQVVFNVPDRIKNLDKAEPHPHTWDKFYNSFPCFPAPFLVSLCGSGASRAVGGGRRGRNRPEG